jgi:hypothetical protein
MVVAPTLSLLCKLFFFLYQQLTPITIYATTLATILMLAPPHHDQPDLQLGIPMLGSPLSIAEPGLLHAEQEST